jgi:antitoxin (DNA-binding transcriptional repressor) of toxin-antitoxin stability system
LFENVEERMLRIDIREMEWRLEELLSQVALEGAEWIITRDGIPVARLMPYYRRAGLHADEIWRTETYSSAPRELSRRAGLHEGAIQTTPDFDEPLPDSFWVDNA